MVELVGGKVTRHKSCYAAVLHWKKLFGKKKNGSFIIIYHILHVSNGPLYMAVLMRRVNMLMDVAAA